MQGTKNPADMLTKGLNSCKITDYLESLGMDNRGGRLEAALKLASVVSRVDKCSSSRPQIIRYHEFVYSRLPP